MKIPRKIDGLKTYLAAGSLALYAVLYLGLYEGNWKEVTKLLMEAMAISGLRNAISKVL